MSDDRRVSDDGTVAFRGELRDHIEEELVRDTIMSEKLNAVETKVDILSSDVKSLVEMWQQARGVLTFVKWVAGLVMGSLALIVFLRDHWK